MCIMRCECNLMMHLPIERHPELVIGIGPLRVWRGKQFLIERRQELLPSFPRFSSSLYHTKPILSEIVHEHLLLTRCFGGKAELSVYQCPSS